MTRKNDFKETLAGAKIKQGGLFGIAAKYQNDTTSPRVGIIISKKISKLATKRNRIRRLLRESLRKRMGRLPKGGRFVILAKQGLLGASREDIDKELEKLLNGR